jgi:hypothetical protein
MATSSATTPCPLRSNCGTHGRASSAATPRVSPFDQSLDRVFSVRPFFVGGALRQRCRTASDLSFFSSSSPKQQLRFYQGVHRFFFQRSRDRRFHQLSLVPLLTSLDRGLGVDGCVGGTKAKVAIAVRLDWFVCVNTSASLGFPSYFSSPSSFTGNPIRRGRIESFGFLGISNSVLVATT